MNRSGNRRDVSCLLRIAQPSDEEEIDRNE